MIGSNFNNSSNFNILNESSNIQESSLNSSKTTEGEQVKDPVKESIARLDAISDMMDKLYDAIELENKVNDDEEKSKKKKMLPFIVLMEINMEIQRRKEKGITLPYYKDKVFVGEILRAYDVDISA